MAFVAYNFNDVLWFFEIQKLPPSEINIWVKFTVLKFEGSLLREESEWEINKGGREKRGDDITSKE